MTASADELADRLTREPGGSRGAERVSAYLSASHAEGRAQPARANIDVGCCSTVTPCRESGTASRQRFACRRASSRPSGRPGRSRRPERRPARLGRTIVSRGEGSPARPGGPSRFRAGTCSSARQTSSRSVGGPVASSSRRSRDDVPVERLSELRRHLDDLREIRPASPAGGGSSAISRCTTMFSSPCSRVPAG